MNMRSRVTDTLMYLCVGKNGWLLERKKKRKKKKKKEAVCGFEWKGTVNHDEHFDCLRHISIYIVYLLHKLSTHLANMHELSQLIRIMNLLFCIQICIFLFVI